MVSNGHNTSNNEAFLKLFLKHESGLRVLHSFLCHQTGGSGRNHAGSKLGCLEEIRDA